MILIPNLNHIIIRTRMRMRLHNYQDNKQKKKLEMYTQQVRTRGLVPAAHTASASAYSAATRSHPQSATIAHHVVTVGDRHRRH